MYPPISSRQQAPATPNRRGGSDFRSGGAERELRLSHTRPPALQLDDIARRFGNRWALRGVSLRVDPGEVVVVIGHNGSGKSTLLRVAATSLRPNRGRATVYGYDVVREADLVRAQLAMLGHAAGVYEDLTAAENLRFALEMLGRPASGPAIAAALAQVGLAAEARTRVRGFSAGMHRRLALARVTLQAPRLLLLDEPYSALDAEGIALVNALVDRTRMQGGAAVLVTHDLARASGVADRWARMDGGRLALVEGTPAMVPAESPDELLVADIGGGEAA